MVLIRVQYDAYNRQFKLLDTQLSKVLEDGETYLIMDFGTSDFEVEKGTGIEANLPHA